MSQDIKAECWVGAKKRKQTLCVCVCVYADASNNCLVFKGSTEGEGGAGVAVMENAAEMNEMSKDRNENQTNPQRCVQVLRGQTHTHTVCTAPEQGPYTRALPLLLLLPLLPACIVCCYNGAPVAHKTKRNETKSAKHLHGVSFCTSFASFAAPFDDSNFNEIILGSPSPSLSLSAFSGSLTRRAQQC